MRKSTISNAALPDSFLAYQTMRNGQTIAANDADLVEVPKINYRFDNFKSVRSKEFFENFPAT